MIPLISEKANREQKEGRYAFVVPHALNKIQIRQEFEKRYGAKVASVATVNMPKKTRTGKNRLLIVKREPYKKAIVTTKGRKTIDLNKLFKV